jgi:hypothetical protein
MYTYTITFPPQKAFAEIKKQIEVMGGSIVEHSHRTALDEALKEVNEGKVAVYANFEEYNKAMKEMLECTK